MWKGDGCENVKIQLMKNIFMNQAAVFLASTVRSNLHSAVRAIKPFNSTTRCPLLKTKAMDETLLEGKESVILIVSQISMSVFCH
jgi:hypothetical protein